MRSILGIYVLPCYASLKATSGADDILPINSMLALQHTIGQSTVYTMTVSGLGELGWEVFDDIFAN